MTTDRIELREEPDWVAAMKRAAELEGLSFSAWVRRLLRREARKVLRENGEEP